MKKIKLIIKAVFFCSILFFGCASNQQPERQNEKQNSEKQTAKSEEPKKEPTVKMSDNGYYLNCPEEAYAFNKDVIYSSFIHETYHSNTTGLDRGYNILLPIDYSKDNKYPVVYFQHGIFGDENAIPKDPNNKIREIYANLQAEGKIPEMILVFPNMYASSDPNQKPAFNQESCLPYDNFINDLVNDLIPHIESKYSVHTDREHRAVLGFSMGGRETLFIGLSRPDLFAYVGAIAPAPGLVPAKDWAMTHPGQFSSEDSLAFLIPDFETFVMICCGDSDKTVGKFPLSYHNIMTKNEISHDWFEVPAADHDSKAIRTGYYNFLLRIFK